jgi:lysine-N-methylase
LAQETPITSPKFMTDFRCAGGACPETCCSSFLVDVDRATFRAYMAVKAPDLGDQLKRHVKKRGNERTDSSYARIQLTPAGACPFLDGERLCSIQKRLGESALSETCRSFPRERWTRDGRDYMGGKLSCPEAARLCLAAPDAMTLSDAGDAEPTVRGVVVAAIEAAARDRDLPIWKAILFAGVITETFLPEGQAEAAADAELRQTIEDYAAETRQALLEEDFALGDQALTQLKILAGVALSAAAKCNPNLNRFPAISQRAIGAILEGAEGFDSALARYAALYRERFKPFDDAHDHALRNYVLNYLYVNRTFLSGLILPQFQTLAVKFGVIRLLLVGLSGVQPDGLDIDDYAAVVSAASRILDHDASVSAEISAALDAVEPRSASLAIRMVIPPA